MSDWDEDKRRANLAKHGVDFTRINGFDWRNAQVRPDERQDYGEARWIALGLIGDRVHVAVFTWRGSRKRLISLRKANRREVEAWANDTQP